MAKYTENFNLIKPEDDEYYDVADFNENMDIIDEALSENSGASEQLQGIISPDGKGVRIIKSIQWKDANHTGSEISYKTCSLSPSVDSSRSIVLMHRLRDSSTATTYVTYTLSNDSLFVSFYPSGNGAAVSLGFWIVEFY